jgi:hypothetical protein
MKIIAFLIALLLPGAVNAADLNAIEFGGQFRMRAETTNVQSYGTVARRRGQDLVLYRTRLHATANPAEGVRAFLQLQDSRTSGSEAGVAANTGNVDLLHGYVDVLNLGGLPLDLRLGRWGLKYGDQRLISTLAWSNVTRAWDGGRLHLKGDNWFVDTFATVTAEVADAKRDSIFSGIYASHKGLANHTADLYLLSREFGNNTTTSELGTMGNTSDRTLGTRFKGKAGPADYSGEAAWQFGRRAGDTVRAWAAAANGGLTAQVPWTPRAGFEYTYASGDGNPADGRDNTFHPLFPFGHYYQGHSDLFSWRNGHDMSGNLKVEPVKGFKAMLAYHHFRLAHARDSWYGAGATAIATDATGQSGKHVGDEINLHFKTKFRKVLNLWFGYARFWPGAFARNTTFSRVRDWAFFQGVVNF